MHILRPLLRRARLGLLAMMAAVLVGACVAAPPANDPDGFEQAQSTSPPSSPTPTPTQTSTLASTPTPTPTPTPATEPWVASLGDSFMSGEAGRWAGNSDGSSSLVDALGPTAYFDAPDGKSELIPLCHRSKSAMVHIGDDGSPVREGNAVGSTNLACSGAQTKTMTEGGDFKPGLDFVGQGTAKQGQAALLQDLAEQRDVTMVLVSIGGNDFGFGGVIADCLEAYLEDAGYCSQDSSITGKIARTKVQEVTRNITTALQNVRKAMRQAGKKDGTWTLVVNLNPDTLALGGQFRYDEGYDRWYDGGCGFYDTDATWAGTKFVGTVRAAAAAALKAADIEGAVLLDLSQLLDRRALCVDGTAQVGASAGADDWRSANAVDVSEWGNEVRAEDSSPYFEQESMHPNYWAQLAARSCVRQLYALPAKVNSSCRRTDSGVTSRREPVVTLTPSS